MICGKSNASLGGGMADAPDFPPEAGPPMAEKSKLKFICSMNLDDLR